jgi:hypothetical protein
LFSCEWKWKMLVQTCHSVGRCLVRKVEKTGKFLMMTILTVLFLTYFI